MIMALVVVGGTMLTRHGDVPSYLTPKSHKSFEGDVLVNVYHR